MHIKCHPNFRMTKMYMPRTYIVPWTIKVFFPLNVPLNHFNSLHIYIYAFGRPFIFPLLEPLSNRNTSQIMRLFPKQLSFTLIYYQSDLSLHKTSYIKVLNPCALSSIQLASQSDFYVASRLLLTDPLIMCHESSITALRAKHPQRSMCGTD